MIGLCILGHLGLGDHIILNAVYRFHARERQDELICIPVKYHNVPSVQFMLRDLDNVVIRPVEDDDEARFFYNSIWKGDRLGLGCFGDKFDGRIWDQSFYQQAGVPFQLRWDWWKCERDKTTEIGVQSNLPTQFIHDDSSRGMVIKVNHAIEADLIRPHRTDHIFQWWNHIQAAVEIHCICSSFALFIDSIDLPNNPKLFLHAYARAGEALPLFKQDWNILK